METRNPRVRSNDDSQARDRTKTRTSDPNEESHQRSRHSLPQQRQKRSTYDPPPRVPVDTFIFHRRGPRVIRNRGLQQQKQAATAADFEITTITRITIERVYFTTRNCTVVCFTNAKKSQHNIKLRVRTSTTRT